MKDQNKAYMYALSAVLLWSTVASAFKISLKYLDFLQLLLLAVMASVAILFFVIAYQQKLNLLKSSSLREYFQAALLGFLNPFLYYVILFKAYSLLPAQEAQPLNYTWAIMLVILSVPLLKQKIGLKSMVAIFVSFLGVLVISTQGHIFDFRFTNLFGASLAVGSSVIWALFWIYNAKDKRDEVVKLFMSFAFGLLYISIATLIFSDVNVGNIKGLAGAVYVGFFEMGITFVLWSKAIALSKTTAKVSRFIFLSPFISLILIHFLVGEDILPSSIIGLALIIAGIALEQFKLAKKVDATLTKAT